MSTRQRFWMRRGFIVALIVFGCHQAWRHGWDYVFAERFAVVVPGKIYRGAWQKSWPMHRLVRQYKFKTVLALAHPADHPLSVSERAMAKEMGFRWVHVPIVDERGTGDYRVINQRLDEAAAVLADPNNYPIYFHCHHGINRASMVQMAYRTRYCGWTLEQATDEIATMFGLVAANHGPDYRSVLSYYTEYVMPFRRASAQSASQAARSTDDTRAY